MISRIALAVAFASAASAAQAQTVISREITNQPVETIVTQGPDGTMVTRRPVDAAPIADPNVPMVFDARPNYAVPATETVVTREVTPAPRVITREVTRTRQGRTTKTRVTTRTISGDAVSRNVVSRNLVLTPEQRSIVYSTISQEREPLQVARVTPAYTDGYVRSTDGYGGDEYETAPTSTLSVNYVGRALSRNVALYDVPQSLAINVPATRPYRYAYMDDRVLLVDPVTGLVVADITR